jgi:hypothetical protein
VPLQFSQTLANDLQAASKPVELYTYAGVDHNISQGFTPSVLLELTELAVCLIDPYRLARLHEVVEGSAGIIDLAALRVEIA